MKIFFLCAGISYLIGSYNPAPIDTRIVVEYHNLNFATESTQGQNIFKSMPTRWVKQGQGTN